MNLQRLFTVFLISLLGFLFTSCGDIPKRPKKNKGPVSENSSQPWNRRQKGEGQGMFGGFQQR